MIQKLGIYQGDPQNSYSERVTIAERQGASENRNCEDKSTQRKTNFRIMMCIFLAGGADEDGATGDERGLLNGELEIFDADGVAPVGAVAERMFFK